MTAASRVNSKFVPHQTSNQPKGAKLPRRAVQKIFENQTCLWNVPLSALSLDVAALASTVGASFGIGTLTEKALRRGGLWDDSAAAGSKFTSDLTDLGDAGTADVAGVPGTEAAADKLIFGMNPDLGMPFGLVVDYTGGTAGVGGTGTWKYLASNGSWKAFPEVVDPTAGLTTAAGEFVVLFEVPDDWVPMIETEIDASEENYYVAFEVATVYATNPVLDVVTAYQALAANVAQAAAAPCNGIIEAIHLLGTNAGTANDLKLQVINHTRQTRGTVTLTKTIDRQRAVFTKPLYVERGDEITLHPIQLDGTTEIQNVQALQFEIAA